MINMLLEPAIPPLLHFVVCCVTVRLCSLL